MGGSASAGDVDGTSITGGTDGTTIGNTGTRLQVEAYPPVSGSWIPSWTSTLRYVDMNVASGGVARQSAIATSTNWTTVFLYAGSGAVASLLMTLETSTGWEMRLTIDSQVVWTFIIEDVIDAQVYAAGSDTSVANGYLSFSESGDRFIWHSPLNSPLRYQTSVRAEVRRPTLASKKFRAGLIVLSKDT